MTYILATGTALPGDPIGNDVLARRFGTSEQWVELFIGTRTRHFAVDLEDGRITHTLTDLGAEAAAQAMSRAGVEPWEIDFIVLGTASPDMLMPATVNLIADRLGIDQVPTYQLQSGCAGAVQALDLGRRLLDGKNRVGLVIGGDVCVKHMVLDREISDVPSSELVNYVLFGDGAGAVVITSEEVSGAIAVREVLNRFTGLGREPGQVIHWFGAGDRDTAPTGARGSNTAVQPVNEDYKAIEERVPLLAKQTMNEILELSGWDVGSLSYLLPPQLSGRMTQRIVKELGADGTEELSCVADTGNNGNALPFLQLDLLRERIQPGQRAVAVAIESSKWITAGFTLEGR